MCHIESFLNVNRRVCKPRIGWFLARGKPYRIIGAHRRKETSKLGRSLWAFHNHYSRRFTSSQNRLIASRGQADNGIQFNPQYLRVYSTKAWQNFKRLSPWPSLSVAPHQEIKMRTWKYRVRTPTSKRKSSMEARDGKRRKSAKLTCSRGAESACLKVAG